MIAGTVAAILMQAAPTGAPPVLPQANWKREPSIGERSFAYPEEAAKRGVSGEGPLKCRINDLGMPVACSIHSETPVGEGFGKALMKLRSKMTLHPPPPGEGPWVLITLRFDADPKLLRLPDPPKYRELRP